MSDALPPRGEPELSADKKKTLDQLIAGEYVLMHLDARGRDLALPAHLLGGEMVTLKVSRLFRGYLEIGETEVTADLLFNGSYFTCRVPYRAIFAFTSSDGKNTVWPESTPKSVLAKITQPAPASPAAEVDRKSEQKPPVPAKTQADKPRPSYLKRVK